MRYRFIARFKASSGKIDYFDVPERALRFDALTPRHPSADLGDWNAAVAAYPELKGSNPIQSYHSSWVRVAAQPGLREDEIYEALYFKVPVIDKRLSAYNSDTDDPTSTPISHTSRSMTAPFAAQARGLQSQAIDSPKSAKFFGLTYFVILFGTCGLISFSMSTRRDTGKGTLGGAMGHVPAGELVLSPSSLGELMNVLKRHTNVSNHDRQAQLWKNFHLVSNFTSPNKEELRPYESYI